MRHLARRLIPQKVRLRLAVIYGALFLVAGATLLAVTYGLVAGSLKTSDSTLTAAQEAKATAACKITGSEAVANAKEGSKPSAPVPSYCSKVFAAGAQEAANNQRAQTLHDLLLFSLIGLGGMTLVSGGIGWVMAGRLLRPVKAITDAARRASERHLGERLALGGANDELKELADTFDDMLDRLDIAFENQRRFVADASHELRTPLTVMRTAVDVTLSKRTRTPEQLEAMAMKIRRSVDQAETLINSLLTLSVAERNPLARPKVDLALLAGDGLETVAPAVAEKNLQIASDLKESETAGDPLLLGRLVLNLIDNSVLHNQNDGWVRVTTGTDDGVSFLTVANGGPSIPEDAVDSLFEPFRRMEVRTNDRDGVGLGLTLVRAIADAHEASVSAKPVAGGGLEISVTFPRLRPGP